MRQWRRWMAGTTVPALATIAAVAAPAATAAPPAKVTMASTVVLDRSSFRPGQGHGTAQADTSGTFSAAGALADAGAERDLLTFTGFAPGDRNVIHGACTLTGALGTITLQYQALHQPVSDPSFAGRWVVADGTGAYAGLRGEGSVSFFLENEESDFPIVHELWMGSVVRR